MHRGGSADLSRADWSGARKTLTYSDSKLLVTALMAAIARRRPDVLSNAVDPGWVPTKMGGPSAIDELGSATSPRHGSPRPTILTPRYRGGTGSTRGLRAAPPRGARRGLPGRAAGGAGRAHRRRPSSWLTPELVRSTDPQDIGAPMSPTCAGDEASSTRTRRRPAEEKGSGIQQAAQGVGVAHGVAVAVVVEVDEHIPARRGPLADPVGPPAQVRRRSRSRRRGGGGRGRAAARRRTARWRAARRADRRRSSRSRPRRGAPAASKTSSSCQLGCRNSTATGSQAGSRSRK